MISPIDGGMFFVKRIEDKRFDLPTLSDESTLCSGNLGGIKLDQYHTLTVSTGDAGENYFVDGTFVCSVPRSKELRRFAPPAKVALVARRGDSGSYQFLIDRVRLTPP